MVCMGGQRDGKVVSRADLMVGGGGVVEALVKEYPVITLAPRLDIGPQVSIGSLRQHQPGRGGDGQGGQANRLRWEGQPNTNAFDDAEGNTHACKAARAGGDCQCT